MDNSQIREVYNNSYPITLGERDGTLTQNGNSNNWRIQFDDGEVNDFTAVDTSALLTFLAMPDHHDIVGSAQFPATPSDARYKVLLDGSDDDAYGYTDLFNLLMLVVNSHISVTSFEEYYDSSDCDTCGYNEDRYTQITIHNKVDNTWNTHIEHSYGCYSGDLIEIDGPYAETFHIMAEEAYNQGQLKQFLRSQIWRDTCNKYRYND